MFRKIFWMNSYYSTINCQPIFLITRALCLASGVGNYLLIIKTNSCFRVTQSVSPIILLFHDQILCCHTNSMSGCLLHKLAFQSEIYYFFFFGNSCQIINSCIMHHSKYRIQQNSEFAPNAQGFSSPTHINSQFPTDPPCLIAAFRRMRGH